MGMGMGMGMRWFSQGFTTGISHTLIRSNRSSAFTMSEAGFIVAGSL